MIQIAPQFKIFQYLEPIDFRKGIDSLVALCRVKLNQDPFAGALFVFINRNRTSIKILTYDGQGFWLCQKRFSEGKVRYWTSKKEGLLSAPELHILLYNGNPCTSNIQSDWRKITS
jgi:transposase